LGQFIETGFLSSISSGNVTHSSSPQFSIFASCI